MSSVKEMVFFGSNYRVVEILNFVLPVKQIICEEWKYNIHLYNLSKLLSIDIVLIRSLNDITSEVLRTTNLGVSCGFGFIFKKEHINFFKHGIWNIHYGPLPEYRGRHPLAWQFLDNCWNFGVTIHEIDEKIDQGFILAEAKVKRSLNDTAWDIEQKIERVLEQGLFVKAKKNYETGNKKRVTKGRYCESLVEKFKDLNPNDYDGVTFFNIFKSQYVYGGVKIKGKVYKNCAFFDERLSNFYPSKYEVIICSDGERLVVW